MHVTAAVKRPALIAMFRGSARIVLMNRSFVNQKLSARVLLRAFAGMCSSIGARLQIDRLAGVPGCTPDGRARMMRGGNAAIPVVAR
jgi:hypothetical protein